MTVNVTYATSRSAAVETASDTYSFPYMYQHVYQSTKGETHDMVQAR